MVFFRVYVTVKLLSGLFLSPAIPAISCFFQLILGIYILDHLVDQCRIIILYIKQNDVSDLIIRSLHEVHLTIRYWQ